MSVREKLGSLKDWLVSVWLRLYANTTFYRVFWTAVAALAGYALTYQTENTTLMFWFTLAGTLLSSLAREKVGARKVKKAEALAEKDQTVGDAVLDITETAVSGK